MPTESEVAAFRNAHSEPLIEIPSDRLSQYAAGERALLLLHGPGDEPQWQALGFVRDEHDARLMLFDRMDAAQNVRRMDVYYYSDGMWPPEASYCFIQDNRSQTDLTISP